MENDATREHRHSLAPAVQEYREGLYEDPEAEQEVAREVADKHSVTQKDLRAAAESGA